MTHVRHLLAGDAAIPHPDDLTRALAGIDDLIDAARELEAEQRLPATLPVASIPSARNLLHYLAVRQHDLRPLQRLLHRIGLSALGSMEPHVLATLLSVRRWLAQAPWRPSHLADGDDAALPGDTPQATAPGVQEAQALLDARACTMLGPRPSGRNTRIMVTLPDAAGEDEAIASDLVHAGMDVARINCSHGTPADWQRMLRNLRSAEKRMGRHTRICFDLPGPKLRAGPFESGPGVFKWKPVRDLLGRTVRHAEVVIVDDDWSGPAPVEALPVHGRVAALARPGDRLELQDARGRNRVLDVVEAAGGRCIGTCERTGYVTPGTRLTLRRGRAKVARVTVRELPDGEDGIVVREGARIDLVLAERGADALRDEHGDELEPARVACPVPEVFEHARVGERVMFDDGRLVATIVVDGPQRLQLRVDHVRGGRIRLREGRGINLPDTDLRIAPLGAADRLALDALARHADMVALSFVQSADDVNALLGLLPQIGAQHLGVVLKIETRRGFEQLPSILLAALAHPAVAVMVARGDLGVEVGFERLAEVQEEIVWLCEAAHVPVIWATQVLESLVHDGQPSRAEVSDASLGARTECVMLNKGPHQVEALRFLSDVLARMQAHQSKKRPLMRRLGVSDLRPQDASAAIRTPRAGSLASEPRPRPS